MFENCVEIMSLKGMSMILMAAARAMLKNINSSSMSVDTNESSGTSRVQLTTATSRALDCV